MWKRKEDERPAVPTAETPAPLLTPKEVGSVEMPKPQSEVRAGLAHIGKSVLIKGELSGSEDLYLDGEVEGTVELRGHSLTIGPHGRVRANIQARDVVADGKIDGNITADRVELKNSSMVVGDIVTQRIVIADGAFFKGSIDIQREAKPEAPKAEAKAAAGSVGAAAGQGSLLDPNR